MKEKINEPTRASMETEANEWLEEQRRNGR